MEQCKTCKKYRDDGFCTHFHTSQCVIRIIACEAYEPKNHSAGDSKMVTDNVNSPCLDCQNRSADCHCTCEKYLAYQAERKEIAKKRIEHDVMYAYKKQKYKRLTEKYKR